MMTNHKKKTSFKGIPKQDSSWLVPATWCFGKARNFVKISHVSASEASDNVEQILGIKHTSFLRVQPSTTASSVTEHCVKSD